MVHSFFFRSPFTFLKISGTAVKILLLPLLVPFPSSRTCLLLASVVGVVSRLFYSSGFSPFHFSFPFHPLPLLSLLHIHCPTLYNTMQQSRRGAIREGSPASDRLQTFLQTKHQQPPQQPLMTAHSDRPVFPLELLQHPPHEFMAAASSPRKNHFCHSSEELLLHGGAFFFCVDIESFVW